MSPTSRPTKISVFATVVQGYTFLFAHAQHFARIGVGPAVILVGVWTFFDWLGSRDTALSSERFGDLGYIVQAWFALRWHRLYLLQRPLSTRGKHIWRFIISAGVFLFVWGVLILIPAVLLSTALVSSMSAADEAGRGENVLGITVLVALCLVYPLSALMLRFLAVFPAMAVEHPGALDRPWRARLGESWRLTKGNGVRLTSVMVLAALHLVIGTVAIGMLFSALPASDNIVFIVIENVLLAVVILSAVAVTSGCSAQAYITLGGPGVQTCTGTPNLNGS